MVKIEKFKRKKVGNQERGSSLTLEQLKQNTNVKFEEIYDYLDKIQHASLDEGGVILGNLDIKGNVTKRGQQMLCSEFLGNNFNLNDIKTPRTIWILWNSY